MYRASFFCNLFRAVYAVYAPAQTRGLGNQAAVLRVVMQRARQAQLSEADPAGQKYIMMQFGPAPKRAWKFIILLFYLRF